MSSTFQARALSMASTLELDAGTLERGSSPRLDQIGLVSRRSMMSGQNRQSRPAIDVPIENDRGISQWHRIGVEEQDLAESGYGRSRRA